MSVVPTDYQHGWCHRQPAQKAKAPKSSLRRWHRKWLVEWWLVELAAVLCSYLLIVVLCVLLATYNSRPLPNFGSVLNSGITLGTVVSFLVIVAIVTALVAVSECLSQLK